MDCYAVDLARAGRVFVGPVDVVDRTAGEHFDVVISVGQPARNDPARLLRASGYLVPIPLHHEEKSQGIAELMASTNDRRAACGSKASSLRFPRAINSSRRAASESTQWIASASSAGRASPGNRIPPSATISRSAA